ncbi:serine/threonine protein kinase [Nocardiopsis exhalans]|uniref:Serine/threonine protein kinase n=1 Tax=Nocardiopsis exhalans TaxID=163604 RepID=A0ABY5DC70_9ACTN|nr:serine/threonine-protein kinase [Nocardiopsis exhalans]USY20964.1 serine/threonine protein kinase [Nocardiopsis exhalans]
MTPTPRNPKAHRLPGLSPLTPDDPEHIGRYLLVGRLGAGGMGAVYGAIDAAGNPLAVKSVHARLAAEPDFRARFAREVALVSRVDSLCTPRFLDADVTGERPWMATEYVPGRTLRQHVREHGPLTGGVLTAFAAGVADALRAVHAQGVVHRDLKPGNVILSPSGPKVLDFGIARALDGTALTRTGGLFGTPGWLAPEQYAGAGPAPSADMFAWGALVAFAATGRDPFGSGEADVLAFRTTEGEADTEGVPDGLRPLVTAALGKDPGRRPDAAGALRALVGPERGGEGQAASDAATRLLPAMLGTTWVVGQHTDTTAWTSGPVRQRPRPRPGRRRGRALMMSMAAFTALVLVAAGGWFLGSRQAVEEAGGGGGAGDTEAGQAEEVGAVQEPPEPVVEFPDTDRGGVNLLEENRDNVAGAVGLVEGGPNSIQLYGVPDPGSDPQGLPDLIGEGEVYAALTFTSAVVEDGKVVLEGEGIYARDSGDLVVHGQDFLAYVFAPGSFSGRSTEEPDLYTPEEDEVVLVLSPEQPSGVFRLTFEGLPPRSLLEYVIEEENLNGGQSVEFGPPTALKCVDAEEVGGPGVNPAHQGGDCDPDWV